jgi:hypothetical protein
MSKSSAYTSGYNSLVVHVQGAGIVFQGQVFHSNMPSYLSNEIERIQRRAMHVIFPDLSYTVLMRLQRLNFPNLVKDGTNRVIYLVILLRMIIING